MDPHSGTVEQVVARQASRAHGVVTRAELLAAGVTPQEIRRRVRKGALIRVYKGVYRAGRDPERPRSMTSPEPATRPASSTA